jgi:hypothetical protein
MRSEALLILALAAPASADGILRGDHRSQTGVLFDEVPCPIWPSTGYGSQSAITINVQSEWAGGSTSEHLFEAQHCADGEWDGAEPYPGDHDVSAGDWGINRFMDVDLSRNPSELRSSVWLHFPVEFDFHGEFSGVPVRHINGFTFVPANFLARSGRTYEVKAELRTDMDGAVILLSLDCGEESHRIESGHTFSVPSDRTCLLLPETHFGNENLLGGSRFVLSHVRIDHRPIPASCGFGASLALVLPLLWGMRRVR